jgi:tRNA-specific 2-thiouridylase
MSLTIAIAVSGGVDSLLAAYVLKQQGHQVFGIHFLTGYEDMPAAAPPSPDDTVNNGVRAHPIQQIAQQLEIPVHIRDLSHAFRQCVVDYFVSSYQAGMTPNPCLVCNPAIKFGTLLNYAHTKGASHLATGHYARIVEDEHGRYHLFKGADPLKDQSYFLARLTPSQLSQAIFPLGLKTKREVKQMAIDAGLRPVITQESQDVCFIKAENYRDFLEQQPGFVSAPGLIEDLQGNVIGEHQGLHQFTIGQRRGINCPAAKPYYVLGIDTQRNVLRVGFKKDTFFSRCQVTDINWIHAPPNIPLHVHTRVRYRHRAAPATLHPLDEHTALVEFDTPQEAVTPGQGAVFYVGEEVLGGGWITPPEA